MQAATPNHRQINVTSAGIQAPSARRGRRGPFASHPSTTPRFVATKTPRTSALDGPSATMHGASLVRRVEAEARQRGRAAPTGAATPVDAWPEMRNRTRAQRACRAAKSVRWRRPRRSRTRRRVRFVLLPRLRRLAHPPKGPPTELDSREGIASGRAPRLSASSILRDARARGAPPRSDGNPSAARERETRRMSLHRATKTCGRSKTSLPVRPSRPCPSARPQSGPARKRGGSNAERATRYW